MGGIWRRIIVVIAAVSMCSSGADSRSIRTKALPEVTGGAAVSLTEMDSESGNARAISGQDCQYWIVGPEESGEYCMRASVTAVCGLFFIELCFTTCWVTFCDYGGVQTYYGLCIGPACV
jgi:hypothetical protein